MGIVIQYNTGTATKEISSSLNVIASRYNNLKKNMLNNITINQIKKQKIKKIRFFLNTLNENAKFLNDEKILEFLQNGMVEGLDEVLENLALTSSSLMEMSYKGYGSFQKDQFFSSLGKLYYLLEIGRANKEISFDYNSLALELNKIASGFINSKQSLKETGNALGRIGAQGAAPLVIQNNIDNILKSLESTKNNYQVIIKDTGTQKILGNAKKTITTDTWVASIDPVLGTLRASLKISDKFNANYKKNTHSTGSPIKLATRTIKNFLDEVTHPLSKKAYEKALMNYISYHKNNISDYHRQDIIKQDTQNWNLLRQAIGAEMMYNDLYFGKGKFQQKFGQNQHVIEDDMIDLYIYGNKIFLASDILNSVNQKRGKGKGQFNLAQISLYQRNNILTNPKYLNSLPKKNILSAYHSEGEEGATRVVYQIIEKSQISYSQTIKFI